MTNFSKSKLLQSRCCVLTIAAIGSFVTRWMNSLPANLPLNSSRLGHYEFKTLRENPALPVVQQQGGTCWCYAATSLIESEIIRLGGPKVKLSEAFFIRHAYFDKARHYLFRQGNSLFYEGAGSHDVILALERNGMVPESQYPGFNSTSMTSNPHSMFLELLSQVKPTVSLDRKSPQVWRGEFDRIMDPHPGTLPTEFVFECMQSHQNSSVTYSKFSSAYMRATTVGSTRETLQKDATTTPRKLAPTLAPTTGQNGQNQSIPVTLATDDVDDQDTKKPSKSLGNTGFLVVGGTELDFPHESLGNTDFSQKVVPTVVPSEPISEPSVDTIEPKCSMLQAVVDAWQLMTEAEKSLCYSMARHAIGKPVFGLKSNFHDET